MRTTNLLLRCVPPVLLALVSLKASADVRLPNVIGAGMVLLIVGPVTSWGTMLVIRKEFGGNTLLTYLVVICITALVLGYCFSII